MATKKNEDEEFAKFMETANIPSALNGPSIPGGLLTLEAVPGRKELPIVVPRQGRPCLLVDIVQHCPDTYSAYLISIRMGAFFSNAAEAVGIPAKTIADWARKGRVDDNEGLDTYYSRFYKDVRKAVAQCKTRAEIAVAKIDPRKWLALGPGKIFGNDWSENTKAEPLELETGSEFTEQRVIEGPKVPTEEGVDTEVVKLNPKTEQEVLDVLKSVLRERRIVQDESKQGEL